MFQLTYQEVRNLRFQIGTSRLQHIDFIDDHGGRRHLPLALTQEGIAMLSSVLRSPRAAQVNISIMRAFVKLREWAETNQELAKKLNELEKKYDHQFKVVFDTLREIITPTVSNKRRKIGFSQD